MLASTFSPSISRLNTVNLAKPAAAIVGTSYYTSSESESIWAWKPCVRSCSKCALYLAVTTVRCRCQCACSTAGSCPKSPSFARLLRRARLDSISRSSDDCSFCGLATGPMREDWWGWGLSPASQRTGLWALSFAELRSSELGNLTKDVF
jgi:hypothetical protein